VRPRAPEQADEEEVQVHHPLRRRRAEVGAFWGKGEGGATGAGRWSLLVGWLEGHGRQVEGKGSFPGGADRGCCCAGALCCMRGGEGTIIRMVCSLEPAVYITLADVWPFRHASLFALMLC
jgi:hypothetical protein